MERRLDERRSVSDGRWELVKLQREEWEPIEEWSEGRYIRLDTGGLPQNTIRILLGEVYVRLLACNISQ